MTDSGIDNILEFVNEMREQRDLLRDAITDLLAEMDPESEAFANAADLYVLTDPDIDGRAEISARHGAMVAASHRQPARLVCSPQPVFSEATS
jgi:hypothetical protein